MSFAFYERMYIIEGNLAPFHLTKVGIILAKSKPNGAKEGWKEVIQTKK